MNNKRGISLIVLVITIIVMIILASAIILALSGNGVIFKTNKAKFQNDMATMKEELSVYISDKELQTNGAYNSDNLSATKDSLVEEGATVEEKTILDIIKSMDKKYIDKIEIVNGRLRYTGSNIDEIKWSDEILEGIRGYNLEENIEQSNTIKLKDGINTSLANYRIYGNGTSLPEEYQQVDYIESTGTQYIDTGVIPTQDTKVKLKMEILDSSLLGDGVRMFGARTAYKDKQYELIGFGHTHEPQFRFGTNADAKQGNVFKNGIYEIETGKSGFYINNELMKEYEETNFKVEHSLLLFACNDNGNVLDLKFSGRFYYFKIFDDDNLVRDLIPCYRKSDGEIGMYDAVNDVFYTNQGTGEFLKGKDIESVGDYVVNMNFDNKWIQGHIWGYESLKTNRLTSKSSIKSEAGIKYEVTSNLPDNIQFAVSNGAYYSYPYNSNDCVYDSGWQDNDFTFTSTVDSYIVIGIRHKDDSGITPEELANYEIKVKKYASETEDGGKYKIPIKVSGINLFSMAKCNPVNKTVNGITFTTLDDERIHIKGKVEDTSKVTSTYIYPKVAGNMPIKRGRYKAKWHGLEYDGLTMLFGINNGNGGFINVNSINGLEEVGFDNGYIDNTLLHIKANTTREFDDIIYLQIEKDTSNSPYEPYVEPREYNIYLDEPLRKIGNYVDYIDFRSQEVVRNVEVVGGTSGEQTLRGLDTPIREKITIPSVMLNERTNVIEVLTKAQPSKIETLYYKK